MKNDIDDNHSMKDIYRQINHLKEADISEEEKRANEEAAQRAGNGKEVKVKPRPIRIPKKLSVDTKDSE